MICLLPGLITEDVSIMQEWHTIHSSTVLFKPMASRSGYAEEPTLWAGPLVGRSGWFWQHIHAVRWGPFGILTLEGLSAGYCSKAEKPLEDRVFWQSFPTVTFLGSIHAYRQWIDAFSWLFCPLPVSCHSHSMKETLSTPYSKAQADLMQNSASETRSEPGAGYHLSRHHAYCITCCIIWNEVSLVTDAVE